MVFIRNPPISSGVYMILAPFDAYILGCAYLKKKFSFSAIYLLFPSAQKSCDF
jgi:hypothetical protein